ncbi:MAG: hypothetical protein KDB27_19965 [Planctomycetales bacterium]|nr:hypothetical protein [Planctomycetales bacterium]
MQLRRLEKPPEAEDVVETGYRETQLEPELFRWARYRIADGYIQIIATRKPIQPSMAVTVM